MTQTDNGRVGLRDYLDMRFNAIDHRLEEYCERQDKRGDDFEARLRALERQAPWSWLTHFAEAVGIVLAALFGGSRP